MTVIERTLRLEWRSVETGIWLGRLDGRFHGVIEGRPGGGFVASSCDDSILFPTLDEAKASFER